MLKLCCSIAHHRALGMMPAARSRRSPSCSPCAHGGCGPPTLSTQRAVASATLASHCTALALVVLAVCRHGKSPAGCPKQPHSECSKRVETCGCCTAEARESSLGTRDRPVGSDR
jgi:hypothetical protein